MKHNSKIFALAAEAFGGRGGIAQSTRDILTTIAGQEENHHVYVLPRLQHETFSINNLRIIQYPAVNSRIQFALAAFHKSLIIKPDIIYCGHVYMAPLAYAVAKLFGAKLVTHVHGLEVWRPLSFPKRYALTKSDLILCVSRHTAQKITDHTNINPKKCHIIYNTVKNIYCVGSRSKARSILQLPKEKKLLLTVSRLDASQKHKGQDLVIDALPKICTHFPDILYLIAGSGNDKERLKQLAKKNGVASKVCFLGYVPNCDLPDLYRAVDLYVMPSKGEGFGISFIEAMCCGTRALGLAEGGATDALRPGELGYAVDATAFVSTLENLLASPAEEPKILSQKTKAYFGQDQFNQRVRDAFSTLCKN